MKLVHGRVSNRWHKQTLICVHWETPVGEGKSDTGKGKSLVKCGLLSQLLLYRAHLRLRPTEGHFSTSSHPTVMEAGLSMKSPELPAGPDYVWNGPAELSGREPHGESRWVVLEIWHHILTLCLFFPAALPQRSFYWSLKPRIWELPLHHWVPSPSFLASVCLSFHQESKRCKGSKSPRHLRRRWWLHLFVSHRTNPLREWRAKAPSEEHLSVWCVLYKWAKDGLCVSAPRLFISSQQAATLSLEACDHEIQIFNYFKNSPNKQSFRHSETAFVYLLKTSSNII